MQLTPEQVKGKIKNIAKEGRCQDPDAAPYDGAVS